jgi:hypothetical protein
MVGARQDLALSEASSRIGDKIPQREEEDCLGGGLMITLGIYRPTIRQMSPRDLAGAAAVTNSAISEYESGKVDQSPTLRKFLRSSISRPQP